MSEVVRKPPADRLARWQAPAIGASTTPAKPSAADLAALRRDAREQGFERGHAEGLAAAQQQLDAMSAQFAAILEALRAPLDAVDDEVVERITDLAVRIARRLVRRELRTNPSEVVAVVREALAVLPLGLTDVRLHLHPDDARLIGETLSPAEGEAAWRIVEDPVITRGGCRISSASSQVDATVETRLARVINTVLGGERDGDRAT